MEDLLKVKYRRSGVTIKAGTERMKAIDVGADESRDREAMPLLGDPLPDGTPLVIITVDPTARYRCGRCRCAFLAQPRDRVVAAVAPGLVVLCAPCGRRMRSDLTLMLPRIHDRDPRSHRCATAGTSQQSSATPCHTGGRAPVGAYHDGSPRYDHDLASSGTSEKAAGVSGGTGAPRTCPACDHHHAVGTTCLACPACGYGIDLTEAARVIFEADSDGYQPGSYPQFNDAERCFRAEGCSDEGAREYHWFADCAWLLTSLSHGGRLVITDEPPSDAAERLRVADATDRDDLTRLCRLCARLWPVPGEVRPSTDEPCTTCGCPWPSHVVPETTGAQHWCSTVWTEVLWRGPGVGDLLLTLLPCRCDRYRPIPLDAPGTAVIHADPDDRRGTHGLGGETDTNDPTTRRSPHGRRRDRAVQRQR